MSEEMNTNAVEEEKVVELVEMNQTARNAYKAEVSDEIMAVIEGSEEFGDFEIVETVKGFVVKTKKAYVEISAVVKSPDFDLEDAISELADKRKAKADRLKKNADAKAKREKKKQLAKKSK